MLMATNGLDLGDVKSRPSEGKSVATSAKVTPFPRPLQPVYLKYNSRVSFQEFIVSKYLAIDNVQ